MMDSVQKLRQQGCQPPCLPPCLRIRTTPAGGHCCRCCWLCSPCSGRRGPWLVPPPGCQRFRAAHRQPILSMAGPGREPPSSCRAMQGRYFLPITAAARPRCRPPAVQPCRRRRACWPRAALACSADARVWGPGTARRIRATPARPSAPRPPAGAASPPPDRPPQPARHRHLSTFRDIPSSWTRGCPCVLTPG